MSFNAGNIKWGTARLGTESGEITWHANYFDDLNVRSGTEAEFDAVLEAAFEVWEDVADVEFVEVARAADADVRIRTGSLDDNIAGVARVTFLNDPGLSEIIGGLVRCSDDLPWSPDGDTPGFDFQAIAIHEIGHVLGLGHVSDEMQIMNPVVLIDELGDGDIAGAQFLYGRDAGDVPRVRGEENIQDAPQSNVVAEEDDGGGGGAGVGILLGLIAAIVGLLLGGPAAGAAVAAGRVGDDIMDDDDETEGADAAADPEVHYIGDGHDHSHDFRELADGTIQYSHAVLVSDLQIPEVCFDENQSPCGCYGPCEHSLEDAVSEFLD